MKTPVRRTHANSAREAPAAADYRAVVLAPNADRAQARRVLADLADSARAHSGTVPLRVYWASVPRRLEASIGGRVAAGTDLARAIAVRVPEVWYVLRGDEVLYARPAAPPWAGPLYRSALAVAGELGSDADAPLEMTAEEVERAEREFARQMSQLPPDLQELLAPELDRPDETERRHGRTVRIARELGEIAAAAVAQGDHEAAARALAARDALEPPERGSAPVGAPPEPAESFIRRWGAAIDALSDAGERVTQEVLAESLGFNVSTLRYHLQRCDLVWEGRAVQR